MFDFVLDLVSVVGLIVASFYLGWSKGRAKLRREFNAYSATMWTDPQDV